MGELSVNHLRTRTCGPCHFVVGFSLASDTLQRYECLFYYGAPRETNYTNYNIQYTNWLSYFRRCISHQYDILIHIYGMFLCEASVFAKDDGVYNLTSFTVNTIMLLLLSLLLSCFFRSLLVELIVKILIDSLTTCQSKSHLPQNVLCVGAYNTS